MSVIVEPAGSSVHRLVGGRTRPYAEPLEPCSAPTRLPLRDIGTRLGMRMTLVSRLKGPETGLRRLMRFAGPGVVAYSCVYPIILVGLISVSWGYGSGQAEWA